MDAAYWEELPLIIDFEIPGKAVGKARPRDNGDHFYTPQNTRDYERKVKACYRQVCNSDPTDKPVAVNIYVYMSVAKSLSKKKREQILMSPPMKKPDIDNIAKIILDALNRLAWNDDKQVVKLSVRKEWGNEERVHVIITEV